VPRDGTLLGALFESLVTLCVRVYAQGTEAAVGHLRTFSGNREVDLIVEAQDKRVVAIEVKLKRAIKDDDVRNLHWLQAAIGDELLDAIVINTGENAYRRTDGVGVVPAALLGP
jgi:predicted AAA+ superfamily ATPase